ncbi:MBG domain-containing protein, partial [Cupriavidus metallidurans]
MNKRLYRLVFNKKRGLLMAVEESATSCVKGGSAGGGQTAGAGGSGAVWLAPLQMMKLAVALLCGTVMPLGVLAQALPQGGKVAGGNATIQTPSANQMVINQASQRAVINWDSFNVGAGNSVQFVQPSSTAQVLNRVVGMNGSTQILGTLTANGQVYIVNPQGVVFGNGAVVNAGALLATTKDIDPNAFMSNGAKLMLGGNGTGGGLVVNEGNLSVGAGGWIALAGDQVRNAGTLNAPNGHVVLAAGDKATLALSNGQMVSFTLDAASANAGIQNTGVIKAEGGQVLLTANAAGTLLNNVINLSGVVDVSGASGGNVTVQGGPQGQVSLAGAQINVSGATGQGGNATVTGQDVALSGTQINATGASGGGKVLVGGNLHGAGNVVHANTVAMDANSSIDASATQNGNGGTVVLWSDQKTAFNGRIAARGGQLGGNGGMVETSSKNLLEFNPLTSVDTRANHGAWGTLLLDPLNIQITHGAAGGNTSSNVNGVCATVNSSITDGQIMAELATSNVTLTASNLTYDDSTVSITSHTGGSLTLNAYEVQLKGQYGIDGGLVLNAASAGSTVTGSIGGSGGLTVSGGGKFTLLGTNTYTGGTNISGATTTLNVGNGSASGTLGTGAIVNNGNLIFNVSGPMQVADVISGAGSVGQAGSGTLYLLGANTYSGSTVISGGTLQVETGGSLGSGSVTDNSHLVFNQSGNTTVTGTISGNGDIKQSGAGTTLFSQNVAVTSMNQTAGKMIFAGNVTLPTGITGTGGTIQVGNGGAGTLTFNAPVNTTGDVVFNSAGATTASQAITAGNLTFNSGTTTTGNINVKNLTVNGAAATTLNGTLQASSGLLFSSTGTSTVNGVISGAASVTQAGSGTVTLVANNTYTGTTTVNAGSTLQVGNNTPTGTLGSGAVTNNGNLIFNNSGAVNLNNNISGSGNLNKTGGGQLYVYGNLTYTGTTTINGTWMTFQAGSSLSGTSQVIDNSGIQFNWNTPATFAVNISGGGQVWQSGSGNLTLTGNNTYTGTTTTNGGTWLIAGSAMAFGSGALNDGGGVNLNGFNVAVANLQGGGQVLNNGANATLTLNGASGGGAVFSGVIKDGTGTVSVVKSGNTNQQFTGNNTYSGGTTINSGGQIELAGGGQIGTGNVTDNGNLNFYNTNNPLTLVNNISGTGSLSVNAVNGKVILAGNNSYTGTTTVQSGVLDFATENSLYGGNTAAWTAANIKVAANATLEVRPGSGALGTGFTDTDIATLVGNLNAANGGFANGSYFGIDTANGNYTLSQALTNTAQGTLGLVADGGKTLTVTGANTYTGQTQVINNTTLTSTGTSLASTSVNLSTGTTYDLLGQNTTIGSLQGNGTVTDNGANATLTVGGDNTNQTFSGVLKNGPAAGGGVLSITKVGTGNQQTISGNNTYSGVTTINSGTLGGNFGNTSLIVNNSTLSFTQNNTIVFNYNYTGTGDLVQNGTGTTILASNITLQGRILVQCGTLDFATESSLFGGDTSQWTANRILVSNGATLAVMTGNGAYGTGFTTSDITTLLTNLNAPSGGFAAGAMFGIDTSNGNYTLPVAVSNTQQGALGLTAMGNHTLFVSGTNTYTGTTTVLGGATLELQSNTAVSTASTVNVNTNGTLRVDAANTTLGNVTLSGTLVANASGLNINNANFYGTLDLAGNNVSIGTINDGSYYGPIAGAVNGGGGRITDSSTTAATVSIGSGWFAPVIQDGNGSVSLVKTGSGTLTMLAKSGSNYSGGTTIAGGTLSVGMDPYNGIQPGFGSGAITMLDGTTLSAGTNPKGGTVVINNQIVLKGNASLSGSAQALVVGQPINVGNGTTLSTGGSVGLSGAISGGGGLAVTSGTTTLSGANSYTGNTSIAGGSTLQVNGGTGLGTGAVSDNGSLIFNTSGNISVAGNISGSGSLTQQGSGTSTLLGTVNLSGATTINNGTLQVGNGTAGNWIGTGSITDNSNLVFNTVGNTTLAGLTGTGSANLTVANGSLNFTQPVNLSGANSTLTASAANGMTVSTNVSATAGISLTTQQGNLTLSGNLAASNGNITLAAGQSGVLDLASGADTAGDVILTNPGNQRASVGVGRTLAIYSGNANSATLQTLVPNGTLYNKVFGSNASTASANANFGINLIYRVEPVLPLTAGTTATDKVYDGSNNVAVVLSPGSHTTTFDGDTYVFNFDGGVGQGSAASAHVGCWSVVVAPTSASVTAGTLGSCVSGYGNVSFAGLTVNITPAALTATVGNFSKVYGTNDGLFTYTLSGLQGTDTMAGVMTGRLGRQTGENVGNYALTNGSLASNGDYALTINLGGAKESITPTNLTVTGVNTSKTYGTSDPGPAFTTAGLVNGVVQSYDTNGNLVNVTLADTVANSLTGSLGRQAGESVGNYAYTLGSLGLASGNASGNYRLAINLAGAQETITQANLTVTVTGQNTSKVYGTNDQVLPYTTSGVINTTVRSYDASGNVVNVTVDDTGTGVMSGNLGRQSGENVGNYALTLGSLNFTNHNYALVLNPVGANETITAANLTVTASNATKTYGTNDPTLGYTTAGLVNRIVQSRDASGNLVNVSLADTSANTLTGSLGRQSGEGVGNYALTNGSLAANGNYQLTINTTGANETITAANLTVNAWNATKTYGTSDPTLGYTTAGLVNGTVQSRDASGNLVNVTLADTAATALTGSLGRQSGEGVGNYAITNGSLAASNYALTINTTGANETITAANLTVNASNATKTYGTDDPTLGYTTAGLVNGTVQSRDANGNLVNVTLADTAATALTGSLGRQSGEGVGNYAITNGSLASSNYALTINTTGANETITAANLTVNASNATKTYGTSDPNLGYTTAGLANGTVQSRDVSGNLVNVTLNDTAANTLTGSLGRQSGENVGNYAITNGSLAANGNYALTVNTTGANETITAANLTVTASNATKTYGTDDPTLAYTTAGLVSGTVQSRDASGNLVNVSLNDTAATTLTGNLGRQSGEGVGNHAITNGSLALASGNASSNYQLTINTTGANETITAANLTVNASNATKTYGTNDPTLGYTTAGLVNGTVKSRDASGNLVNVTLADTAATALTGSLGRQSGENVGNYAITNGSLASTNNYALTINTTGANETITAANLTVNASNATKTYGTSDPTLGYTTAGLVNGTVQSRDASGNLVNVSLADTAANTLTGGLGRQSGEGVGNYALTNGSLALASGNASSNYQLTVNTTGANETITVANLTVNASNATKTYGTDDPTLGYTTAGLVNGTVRSRDASGALVNVTLNDTAANTLTGSLGRQSGEGVGN